MPRPVWTQGVPSIDVIRAHGAAHPILDIHGRDEGSGWLCIDPDARICRFASPVRLRVGNPGEVVMEYDGGIPRQIDAENLVLIANGYAFWQRLEQTRWASRSRYTPIDIEGIPVLWAPE